MNTLHLSLTALALAFGDSAHAVANMQLAQSLTRLSVAEFANRTHIEDDQLEERIVLSTERSSRREGPIRGASLDDAHARIVVDRAAGRVVRQVWHDISYIGAPKDITAVHYLVDGQLHRTQPQAVEHWLDRCPAVDMPGQCLQMTRIIFEVPEQHVRAIGAAQPHGSRQPWLIRFKDDNGESVTVGFAPAELAGLEQAYQNWRHGRP